MHAARETDFGRDRAQALGQCTARSAPAGAIPKDGPSAGVAMFMALASLFTDRAVRHDVAMTGEISLRGPALPVGGVKDKVLCAQRAGVHTVLLPARNERDLLDVPAAARHARLTRRKTAARHWRLNGGPGLPSSRSKRMNIGTLCTRRIVTINTASSLAQAATLMREFHVGALVVITQAADGEAVSGIVTDRDLVLDVLARGLDVTGVCVGDVARERIASVSEDDDLEAAIAVMQERGVRRLLVTDANQHLSGIVSLDDLIVASAGTAGGLAQVIRRGIEREVAQTGTPAPPAPIGLRVPAVGTAGWGATAA